MIGVNIAMEASISILTATYNSAGDLPGLMDSLRIQTDRQFEWIIVDGASTDGTLELVRNADDIVTKWISEPDFGIYDALNKALKLASGQYYLVVGADDRLSNEAVQQYRRVAERTNADVVTAWINRNGRLDRGEKRLPWLYAHHAYVSEHAVGTLIRRSLHEKHGQYAKSYPVGADVLFLKTVCADAGTRLYRAEFLAGKFGFSGTSRKDRAGAICDYFRAQLATEQHRYLQVFIFAVKLIWNARSLVESSRSR